MGGHYASIIRPAVVGIRGTWNGRSLTMPNQVIVMQISN